MYKNKLVVEYDKFDKMENAYNNMKEINKKKTEQPENSIEERVVKIKTEFDSKLLQYEDEVKSREKESEEKIKAVEEILKQTEEDADKEILEIKTKYEIDLKKEKESNVKVGENCSIINLGKPIKNIRLCLCPLILFSSSAVFSSFEALFRSEIEDVDANRVKKSLKNY